MSMTRIVAGCAALTGALLATSVHAQAFGFYRSPVAQGQTQGGSVGLAVLATREYAGSDESRTLVVPTFDYQWANGVFLGASNGLGINFSQSGDTAYGLRVTVDTGRDASRSAALTGLGDVRSRAEVGAFAKLPLSETLQLASTLRYGSGSDRDGVVLGVGVNFSTPLSPSLRLSAGVASAWANRAYTQSYFGVSPAQSATSVYAPYSTGAGLRDVRLNLGLAYAVAPSWTLTGRLSLTQLLGDAKDSPLVRERSSFSGAVTASYRF